MLVFPQDLAEETVLSQTLIQNANGGTSCTWKPIVGLFYLTYAVLFNTQHRNCGIEIWAKFEAQILLVFLCSNLFFFCSSIGSSHCFIYTVCLNVHKCPYTLLLSNRRIMLSTLFIFSEAYSKKKKKTNQKHKNIENCKCSVISWHGRNEFCGFQFPHKRM